MGRVAWGGQLAVMGSVIWVPEHFQNTPPPTPDTSPVSDAVQGTQRAHQAAGLRDLRRSDARSNGTCRVRLRRRSLAVRGACKRRVPDPPRRPRHRRHAAAALDRAWLPYGRAPQGSRVSPALAAGAPPAAAAAASWLVRLAGGAGSGGACIRRRPAHRHPSYRTFLESAYGKATAPSVRTIRRSRNQRRWLARLPTPRVP